jgi:hypothetical protein
LKLKQINDKQEEVLIELKKKISKEYWNKSYKPKFKGSLCC